MNKETQDHARRLFREGAEPTIIFRFIIKEAKVTNPNRIFLLNQILEIFNIGLSDFMLSVGRWDFWADADADEDDKTVNEQLKGKLTLKESGPNP